MARARSKLARVGFFARGYDVTQVDAVLEAARGATAEGPAQRPRAGEIRDAGDVRGAAFTMRRRGYDPAMADRMLDKLEDTLAVRAARSPADPADSADELAATLRPRLDRPAGRRFARAKRLRRGYRATEVDELLARLTLDGTGALGSDQLSRGDVRGAVFSAARGAKAYDPRVVDAYLDRVLDYLQALRRKDHR